MAKKRIIKKAAAKGIEAMAKKYEALMDKKAETFKAQREMLSKFEKMNPALKGHSDVSLVSYLDGFYERDDVKQDPKLKLKYIAEATWRREHKAEIEKLEEKLKKAGYFKEHKKKVHPSYNPDDYADARGGMRAWFKDEGIEGGFSQAEVEKLAMIIHDLRERSIDGGREWEDSQVTDYLTNLTATYKNKKGLVKRRIIKKK